MLIHFFTKLQNRREDRIHNFLSSCFVSGCTATFETSEELELHIAANLHNIEPNTQRATNDIARGYLTEIIRTTKIDTQERTKDTIQSQNVLHADFSKSAYYKSFTSVG